MRRRTKTLVVGIGGFHGGFIASQYVDWALLPKALLAMTASLRVSLILHLALPCAGSDPLV